jgi:heme-degrading monooxygenase HmoA
MTARTGIVERAIFSIKPGTERKDFIAAFAKARPHIEAAHGFQRLEMRPGIESPDSWLLMVWWDTVDDHIKGFRESEGFAEWRKHLGPFFDLGKPPAVEHYGDTL